MKSAVFATSALSALTLAAPTVKRADPTDIDILNYALTLEHLEGTFYTQGLANFTVDDFKNAGFDEDVYNGIKTVAADEQTHVQFLTDAIKAAGATPVAACSYDFGITDVKSFLATAAVLEGVGTSAYLGAAADIVSKNTLTAAGSILGTEARHSTNLRTIIGQEPVAQPFDNPLSLNEVFTLAAPFITSCPKNNPSLPVKAFPSLVSATSNPSPAKTGDTITLGTMGYKIQGQVFAAFITATGPVFVDASEVDGGWTVVVPKGVNGQSYVVLTGCNIAANDDTIVAGPAIIEIAAS